MNRRDFLRSLLGATALTAAGLVVPSRTTYCFLTNNPLARDPMGLLGLIDDETYINMYWPLTQTKPSQQFRLTGIEGLSRLVVRMPYRADPEAGGTRFLW